MPSGSYNLTHLKVLEAESIHNIRVADVSRDMSGDPEYRA
jgi:hypothetical protein